MEHRCTDRQKADIKILIYKYNIPVAIGRIKNGSRYGLYIETDYTEMESLQQISIELMHYRQLHKLQRYKFDAIVIHKNDRGFGVELDALKEENSTQLLELLSLHNQATFNTRSHLSNAHQRLANAG